jgi:thioredoxin 1
VPPLALVLLLTANKLPVSSKQTFINNFIYESVMVQELNVESFKEAINGDLPIIVDFWASWCGPCKMLAPVFEEVSKDYEGKLKFAKISTEDFPSVAQENAVQGIPCLIVFNKGQEVDRIVGFKQKTALKESVDGILEKI